MPMPWALHCFVVPGAGAEPTASSVIADIVDVARSIDSTKEAKVNALGCSISELKQRNIVAIEEIETSFYMRFSALDKPGVLSEITTIMGDSGISIEAIVQKEQPVGEDYVNVIIITNVTQEKQLSTAVERIESLETVRDSIKFIRVEHLDQ